MLKRLLVVDDEPNLLRAVAAVLRGENFEVTTARNGREALDQRRPKSAGFNRLGRANAGNGRF